MNSNSDLVWLKVLDADWLGTTYDVVDAIEYAKENWIQVLNMSFWTNSDPKNSIVCEAISEAKINWIYTVVSAWNSKENIKNKVPAWCSDTIVVGSFKLSSKANSFEINQLTNAADSEVQFFVIYLLSKVVV